MGPFTAEYARVDPAALVAMSATRTVVPISLVASVYVLAFAPGMSEQLCPCVSQPCHRHPRELTTPVNDPAVAVSVLPAVAVPDTDGLLTTVGKLPWMGAVGADVAWSDP